jgi:transcriptional regulator NrdR family protein
MKCPQCGNEKSRVLESVAYGSLVWRARECNACGHQWSTSECEDTPPIPVPKLRKQLQAS